MKNNLQFLLLITIMVMTSCNKEDSSPPVEPGFGIALDANFKNYLLESFDADGDKEISDQEAFLVKVINCQSMHVQSLSGIERFVNLTFLNCSENQLEVLDVSKNTIITG